MALSWWEVATGVHVQDWQTVGSAGDCGKVRELF